MMRTNRISLIPGTPLLQEVGPNNKKLPAYTVRGTVGEAGAFAITYICDDHVRGREVAIKEFYPSRLRLRRSADQVIIAHNADVVEFEQQRNRFNREALSLSKISHHFNREALSLSKARHHTVVETFDFFNDFGTSYIVMELVEGKPLVEYIEDKGRIPWLKALSMLLPILDVFDAIHETGSFYQDGSPNNLLIRNADESLVLIDFGGVRPCDNGGIPMTSVGTIGFAAPELSDKDEQGQDDASRRGPKSDIYSLSALLYYMIAGDAAMLCGPGGAYIREACIRKGLPDPLPGIEKVVANLPAFLVDAIHAGMAVNPDDRPPDIDAFRALLTDPASTSARVTGTRLVKPAIPATGVPAANSNISASSPSPAPPPPVVSPVPQPAFNQTPISASPEPTPIQQVVAARVTSGGPGSATTLFPVRGLILTIGIPAAIFALVMLGYFFYEVFTP